MKLTAEKQASLSAIVQEFCNDTNKQEVILKTGVTVDFYDQETTADSKFIVLKLVEFVTQNPQAQHIEKILWMICVKIRHASLSSKVWRETVDLLISILPSLQPQGKLYVFDFIGSSRRDESRTEFLKSILEGEKSDKIAACLLFFMGRRLARIRYQDFAIIESLWKDVIENKRYGPLSQIAAAMILVLTTDDKKDIFEPAIPILVDAIVHDKQYTEMWEADGLDAFWAPQFRTLRNNRPDFAYWKRLPDASEEFSWVDAITTSLNKIYFEDFTTQLLAALSAHPENAASIVKALLNFSFKDKLTDAHFSELSKRQQITLTTLANYEAAVQQRHIFKLFNIPEDIAEYINAPITPEIADPKMEACLATVASIDWKELNTAYGTGEYVLKSVKALAGKSKLKRKRAMGNMNHSYIHAGNRYRSTVPLVGIVIQLLECNRVEDKDELLEWLETCIVISYCQYQFKVNAFKRELISPTDYDPDNNPNNSEQFEVYLQCYDEAEKGWPTYIGILLDDSSSLQMKLNATVLLSRFPNIKKESLSALRSVYKNASNPPVLRGSAIFAISHLASSSPDEAETLKTTLEQHLASQIQKDIKNLEEEQLLLLFMEAFALGRLYNAIRDSVLEIFMIAIPKLSKTQTTAFGTIGGLLDEFVPQVYDNCLMGSFMAKFKAAPPSEIAEWAIMLLHIFPDPGYVSSSGAPEPEFYELELNYDQASVLEAIISSDTLWGPENAQLNKVRRTLHEQLQIKHLPSRAVLQASFKKWAEADEAWLNLKQ